MAKVVGELGEVFVRQQAEAWRRELRLATERAPAEVPAESMLGRGLMRATDQLLAEALGLSGEARLEFTHEIVPAMAGARVRRALR